MRIITLAGAALNTTPLDWENNQRVILGAIDSARQRGAMLLCLPELCITGYGCEDAFFMPSVRRMARRVLRDLLPATRGMVVSFGLPVMHQSALFNAACLVVDGQIAGFVAKRHLAGEGLHYEPRWFKPWPQGVRSEIELDGAEYPIGDISFRIGRAGDRIHLGFEICEDAWVATRPGAALARKGADIIFNPSASHFAFQKLQTRKGFVIEGSRAFGVTYVYSNLLGNEAGRAIYDGGVLIASGGTLLAAGPRLGLELFSVCETPVDIDATRQARARLASFEPALATDHSVVDVAFDWSAAATPAAPLHPPPPGLSDARLHGAWEHGPDVKEEEFARAVSLALFDYLRKSRSSGFVVSLSGGADSSACCALAWIMAKRAWTELGPKELAQRLRLDAEPASLEALMPTLLRTIYQSTRNSSQVTSDAARSLASGVHSRHLEFDVDGLVASYIALGEQAVGRPLSWERDDLALQNIQARARGPSAWIVTNLAGALLLTTSNRSEAAVGYATMDGDTCGGLAPLGGIDKAFLRHWLRWMESTGPQGVGPLLELRAVNVQQPTAELRPSDRHQTDENDLMPYDVLEAIEDAAIGQKQSPAEVLATLRARVNGSLADDPWRALNDENLKLWITRFFRLFCRNQWKRERYAPSFHLDDKNLDPKTWCRFPILSGGFERELRELQ
ncbi:MAG: NAD(+) synthase [Planctomycetota bacterium]|nr:NAD(+) synthase [Planctomycetota bacterium]